MQKYSAYQHSSISLPVILKFVELMLHLLVPHLHTTFLVSHPVAEITKTKPNILLLKKKLGASRCSNLQCSSKYLGMSFQRFLSAFAYKTPKEYISKWERGEERNLRLLRQLQERNKCQFQEEPMKIISNSRNQKKKKRCVTGNMYFKKSQTLFHYFLLFTPNHSMIEIQDTLQPTSLPKRISFSHCFNQ